MSKSRGNTQAQRIVGKFGGKSALSQAISEPETTVRGWFARGNIPTKWHRPIIDAADCLGIALTDEDWFGRALPKSPAQAEEVRS